MTDNKKWINDNTARIEALTRRVAENNSGLTQVLDEQDTIITAMENSFTGGDSGTDYLTNVAYAKQMDSFNNILSGRDLVERDYTEKEITRLETLLINVTKGELVNG